MTGGMDAAALKDLTRRSDLKGLMQLLGHGAALGASGLLIAEAAGSLWVAPALLAHGVILSFLFAPLHETIHRTAFRDCRLNDALARICGAALLLPPVYYRAFHFARHRQTQDPTRDPELAGAGSTRLSSSRGCVRRTGAWRAPCCCSTRRSPRFPRPRQAGPPCPIGSCFIG